jgi:hypothetical protein
MPTRLASAGLVPLLCATLAVGCATAGPVPWHSPLVDDDTALRLLGAERRDVPVDGSPARGPADALVTVVLFCDPLREDCRGQFARLGALQRDLPAEVRLVWKHVVTPRKSDTPESASRIERAARAVFAAGEQERAWDMLGAVTLGSDDEASAKALGLDVARWTSALTSSAVDARLDRDAALATRLGVDSTPRLFVNGRDIGWPYAWYLRHAVANELEVARGLAATAAHRDVYAALARDADAPPCPVTADAAPPFSVDGVEFVPVCRQVWVDGAATDRERLAARRAFVTASAVVQRALGTAPPELPTVFCKTKACQRAFSAAEPVAYVWYPGVLADPATLTRPVVFIEKLTGELAADTAHELTHVVTHVLTRGRTVPEWFREGLSTSISGRPGCAGLPRAVDTLRRLETPDGINTFWKEPRLDAPTYCQGRVEVDAWVHAHEPGALPKLLEAVGRGTPFTEAWGPLLTE